METGAAGSKGISDLYIIVELLLYCCCCCCHTFVGAILQNAEERIKHPHTHTLAQISTVSEDVTREFVVIKDIFHKICIILYRDKELREYELKRVISNNIN